MTLTTWLPAVAALAAVIAAILLGGRAARMAGFARRPGQTRLAVVETLNIDPRRRVVLLQCDGRHVLLLAGQTDQVLGWLPEPQS